MATESKQEPSEKPSAEAKGLESLGLNEILDQLAYITRRLQTLGMLVLMAATVSLFCVVAGIVTASTNLQDRIGVSGRPISLFAIILAWYGMLLLFRWDQLKRRGSLYYEEISDELEWRHRSFRKNQVIIQGIKGGSIHVDTGGSPDKHGNGKPVEVEESPRPTRKARRRPNLAVRLQLREFLNASTLPFAAANTSSMLYLVWFIFCITVGLVGLVGEWFPHR